MERNFPRAEIPGVDYGSETYAFARTVLEKADIEERHARRQQRLMAEAMIALGKPIFRRGKPKRKPVTKHVRHMRAMRVRADYALESFLAEVLDAARDFPGYSAEGVTA